MNWISPSKEEKEDTQFREVIALWLGTLKDQQTADGGMFTALATWGWGWWGVFMLEQYVIVCEVE